MPLVFCADFWDVSEGMVSRIVSVAYHLGYRVPVNCAKCVGRRRHRGAVVQWMLLAVPRLPSARDINPSLSFGASSAGAEAPVKLNTRSYPF